MSSQPPESDSQIAADAPQAEQQQTSPILRLSDDILAAIFHAIVVAARPAHLLALCVLSAVCMDWRRVAHGTPLLWCEIYIRGLRSIQLPAAMLGYSYQEADSDESEPDIPLYAPEQVRAALEPRARRFADRLNLHLQHAGDAPLVLDVDIVVQLPWVPRAWLTSDILDRLLQQAQRWKCATLVLDPGHIAHIAKSSATFPVLERISLTLIGQSFSSTPCLPPGIALFKSRALRHVHIRFETALGDAITEIPWRQLQKVKLSAARPDDINKILKLLPCGAHLWLDACNIPGTIATQTDIAGLFLDNCHSSLVASILQSVFAPALTRFVLRGSQPDHIPAFLARSTCALQHLGIQLSPWSPVARTTAFLAGDSARGVTNFEVFNGGKELLAILRVLGDGDAGVLPMLRTLRIPVGPEPMTAEMEAALLEVCEARGGTSCVLELVLSTKEVRPRVMLYNPPPAPPPKFDLGRMRALVGECGVGVVVLDAEAEEGEWW
ncbi:hypothetical protein MKEN_00275200 [Mycena kentingensis (nom. inval.)]|nr:hypothetical protein MKEN_00275200 [Mycena kentingensis (nom. inval.)]